MGLYKFQEKGVKFLLQKPHRMLADEMGLGKSIQAVEALARCGACSVLIICPAIIKETWAKHITDWTTFEDSSIQIVQSKSDVISNKRVIILNYELLQSENKKGEKFKNGILKQLLERIFDVAIIDEAHRLKNISSKISNILLAKAGKRNALISICNRKWFLTGTPMPNRPIELFPILRTMAPETIQPYESYEAFGNRFCGGYEGQYGLNFDGASNIEDLKERLKGFMLRREVKDVITQMPNKIICPIYTTIKLNTNQSNTPLATLRKAVGDAKIPFVVEYVRDKVENSDEKVVIFAYTRSVIEQIADHDSLAKYEPVFVYGNLSYEDKKFALKQFTTNDKCRIIILQVNSAGEGIDGLQSVSSCVVFAEVEWSAGSFDQAVGRLHRLGQKELVRVYPIIARDTLDEYIFGVYNKKSKVITKLLEV